MAWKNSIRVLQEFAELSITEDYAIFFENEHNALKDNIAFALGAKKEDKVVEEFYDIILKNNFCCEDPNIVYLRVVILAIQKLDVEETEDVEPTLRPLFVLKKCNTDGCRIFIDFSMRVYDSFQAFLDKNTLTKCKIVAPEDAKLTFDDNNVLQLVVHDSPDSSVGHVALTVADMSTTIGGVLWAAAYGISLIPAITFSPIVLAGATVTGGLCGAYSIGRSIGKLVDRGLHQQSNSVMDSSARASYLNIIAGSVGVVGAGANAFLARQVTKGVALSTSAIVATEVINISNMAVNTVCLANQIHHTYECFVNGNFSMMDMVELGSSILFFSHSVYSYSSMLSEKNRLAFQSAADLDKPVKKRVRRNENRGKNKSGIRPAASARKLKKFTTTDDVKATMIKKSMDGVKVSTDPTGDLTLNNNNVGSWISTSFLLLYDMRDYFASNISSPKNSTDNSKKFREYLQPCARLLVPILTGNGVQLKEHTIRLCCSLLVTALRPLQVYLLWIQRLAGRVARNLRPILQEINEMLMNQLSLDEGSFYVKIVIDHVDSIVEWANVPVDMLIDEHLDRAVEYAWDQAARLLHYAIELTERPATEAIQRPRHDCSTCKGYYFK